MPAPVSCPRAAGTGRRGARWVRAGARKAVVAKASHAPIAKMDENLDSPMELEDYLVLGLSVCFRKEKGKLVEAKQVEPIAPQSLECMSYGASTSFERVTAVTLGEAMAFAHGTKDLPDALACGQLCEAFLYRAEAAARCWKRPYPEEMLMALVPLGSVKEFGTFDCENNPRVLNAEHVVSDADNVKQDLSIDVYGRKEAAEEKGEEVEDAHVRNGAKRAAKASSATSSELDDILGVLE